MQLKLRWWVVGLLFVSTIINYVDRQTFSILAHEIQKSLHITDVGYAGVVQLFLVSYTLAYLLTGRVTDRLGSRLSMTVFIVWWSIAGRADGFCGIDLFPGNVPLSVGSRRTGQLDGANEGDFRMVPAPRTRFSLRDRYGGRHGRRDRGGALDCLFGGRAWVGGPPLSSPAR